MKADKTRFYVTRHGQTEWNLVGRAQGHLNSPLTDLGKRQAAKLGERLKDAKIDVAYCSTTGRTLQTSQIVLADRAIEIVQRDQLRELNFGDWEGKSWQEIEQLNPEQLYNLWKDPANYQPDNGEKILELVDRITAEFERIGEKHKGETVFVTVHGGVVKALMYAYQYCDIKNFWTSEPYAHSCSLSILTYQNGKFSYDLLPDTAHLSQDEIGEVRTKTEK